LVDLLIRRVDRESVFQILVGDEVGELADLLVHTSHELGPIGLLDLGSFGPLDVLLANGPLLWSFRLQAMDEIAEPLVQ
jgi:hypothetical protein